MLNKIFNMIRPFLERSFIKISGKINITKFKIMEILVILYFGFIGLIDKNLLFISIIILLLLQHFSGFLYIKYDKKEIAALRGLFYIILLIIAIKFDIELLMILLMFMCLGSAFFLSTGIANLASLSSMTFGFIASYYMYATYNQDNIKYHFYAVLLIVIGSMLDFIDGKLARIFNKNKDDEYKQNGVLIDDIADGSTFGLAISVLIFFHSFSYTNFYIAIIPAIIYFVCVIYRLYSFTKTKDQVPYGYFEGLPSPAAALIIAVGSLVLPEILFIVLVLLVSTAMVSFSIQWIHFKMIVTNKIVFIIAILSLILLIYGTVIKNIYFLYPFFLLSIIYTFSPAIRWMKK
jgi:phosphatidylserine synthase